MKYTQEQVSAGTVTLWREAKGDSPITATSTPGWPATAKRIKFASHECIDDTGRKRPGLAGSYEEAGKTYAIATQLVSNLGEPIPEEHAQALILGQLRVDYAARMAGK